MSTQREIKFRAWATHSREMVDLKAITPLALAEGIMDEGDGLFIPFRDDVILMQYTGLKDKNGKGIYEGDVIRAFDSQGTAILHVIEWSVPDARFTAKNIPIEFSTAGGSVSQEWITVYGKEVVGNIHENPELLSA